MGIVARLLCVSLLVGICLAVNGAPQQPLEPRMTEVKKISQLKQEIESAKDKKDYPDDCPPPRQCGGPPHDPNDPNSQGWVHANEVAMGQLPDDVKAKMPQWIPARTVPFLPEPASTGATGGPCCICPQCGLSFYTPNDYWGHLPSCPVPGPKPCVQTTPCGVNSHFDPDPRVCMCRPGPAPSSTAVLAATGTDSSSSSTGEVSSTGLLNSTTSLNETTPVNGTMSSTGVILSSTADTPVLPVNGSLIATGSINVTSLTGGGVPEMMEYADIQAIGEEVGEQVAEAIQSGQDQALFGY